MAWPEDRADVVRELAAGEWKSADIADEVNRRFDTSYTASAIIGLCKRRGWQLRETAQSRAIKDRKARQNAPGAPRRRREHLAAEFMTKPVRLLDLEDWHCRTVVIDKGQDGLAEFCGRKKMDGRSYCAICQPRYIDHAAMAEMEAERRRREVLDAAYTPSQRHW